MVSLLFSINLLTITNRLIYNAISYVQAYPFGPLSYCINQWKIYQRFKEIDIVRRSSQNVYFFYNSLMITRKATQYV